MGKPEQIARHAESDIDQVITILYPHHDNTTRSQPARSHELTDLLRQIQQLYDNTDSIILLPVGEDMLNSLQCIGQSFDIEQLTAPKHTIFV